MVCNDDDVDGAVYIQVQPRRVHVCSPGKSQEAEQQCLLLAQAGGKEVLVGNISSFVVILVRAEASWQQQIDDDEDDCRGVACVGTGDGGTLFPHCTRDGFHVWATG